MTNPDRSASLEKVLDDYAHASQEFDAAVLLQFIDRYPEHATALRQYAHLQLTAAPATAEEIEREVSSDEKMLPRQSRLLQRLQQLRGSLSASDVSTALNKLSSISGNQAIEAATIAAMGSLGHGEDLVLLTVLESSSEVRNVPQWFFDDLGKHIDVPPAALIAAVSMKRHQMAPSQRFSAKDKLSTTPSTTWEAVVEECVSDETIKTVLLTHARPS